MLLKTRSPEATLSEATSSEAGEAAPSEATEAASSEADSSEVISPEAEDQLDLQKIQRIEESTLQKLSIGFENTNKGLVEFCNGHFKSV